MTQEMVSDSDRVFFSPLRMKDRDVVVVVVVDDDGDAAL
jgi:hypothetical protein